MSKSKGSGVVDAGTLPSSIGARVESGFWIILVLNQNVRASILRPAGREALLSVA